MLAAGKPPATAREWKDVTFWWAKMFACHIRLYYFNFLEFHDMRFVCCFYAVLTLVSCKSLRSSVQFIYWGAHSRAKIENSTKKTKLDVDEVAQNYFFFFCPPKINLVVVRTSVGEKWMNSSCVCVWQRSSDITFYGFWLFNEILN